MNEVWEICVDVAGITLIGALVIALALVGYKMALLPFLKDDLKNNKETVTLVKFI